MLIHESPHIQFANQTMDWFSNDNLDRYQKNYNDLKKREILTNFLKDQE